MDAHSHKHTVQHENEGKQGREVERGVERSRKGREEKQGGERGRKGEREGERGE